MKDKMARLAKMEEQARAGGGKKRIEQQHAKGKLTARERIDLLLDKGSFEELDPFITHQATEFGLDKQKYLGDSVVAGSGKIDGRLVFIYSQDFTVLGGTISEVSARKACKVIDLAVKKGAPVIAIWDSGGARIQEGVGSLGGVGDILLRNTLCSGVIPQISVVMGPSAGGAVYSPAITDFVFMVEGISQMYITGPDVVKAVISIDISHEELGGAKVHSEKSGVAHFVTDSEKECLAKVRQLLGFLPQSFREDPPRIKPTDDPNRSDESLLDIVPEDPGKVYDMKRIISSVVDNGDFMEVHQDFAPNLIVGFGRLDGQSVGIVAQQPAHMAGIIDINASVKGARFVRFCDAFNIPLLSFVDVPGFMPGPSEEKGGIIRHGAKHLRGDINYAWPSAEIAVMGPEGAVNILFKQAIAGSDKPDQTREQLVGDYKEKFAHPYLAAGRGYIDNVIDPRQTRARLIRALGMLENRGIPRLRKKHGNIPL
jgi:acetyl-CoA carboxylase carboxyltransferase component